EADGELLVLAPRRTEPLVEDARPIDAACGEMPPPAVARDRAKTRVRGEGRPHDALGDLSEPSLVERPVVECALRRERVDGFAPLPDGARTPQIGELQSIAGGGRAALVRPHPVSARPFGFASSLPSGIAPSVK